MAKTLMQLRPGQILLAILLIKLVIGVLYITQQPLWQYHEADFLRVARYVRDNGRLPQLDETAAPDTRNESQPPLYYFLLTPFVSLLDDNQPAPPGVLSPAICDGYNGNLTNIMTTRAYNPPMQGVVLAAYVLRGLNLFMSMAAVMFTYLAGRLLVPTQPALALIGASITAFEPTLTALAGEINNDNLILMLGASHLWLSLRLLQKYGNPFVNSGALLTVSGMAILSKLSGWLLLGISIVLILFVIGRMLWRSRSPRQVQIIGIAAVVVALAFAGLLIFNIRQYGSIFGRYRQLDELITKNLQNISLPLASGMAAATLQDTVNDYQSPLAALQPRAALLTAYRGLLLVSILAAMVALIRAWWQKPFERRWLYAFLWVYTLLAVGLVIFRSILNNTGWNFVNTMLIFAPVRYYAPALPALALLFSAGFSAILPARLSLRWNWLGVGAAACWLIVALAWLSIPIRNNQLRNAAVISPEQFATISGVQGVENTASNNNEPRVLGYQFQPRPDEGLIGLTLYVDTPQPLSTNYIAQVNLNSGSSKQSCRFLPVRGLYPTPRWQPDEVVVVQADIPNCVAGLSSPANLQLTWVANTSADLESDHPIDLGIISQSMAVAANCPANLGIIGGGLQILKNNTLTSLTLTNDVSYLVPSVNWLARHIPPEAVTRVYTLTLDGKDTTYTCAGAPRQQSYPFDRWTAGETVYFDECVLPLRPETPKGTYTIRVGIQDAQRNWLPAQAADGTPLSENMVEVGKVDIQ